MNYVILALKNAERKTKFKFSLCQNLSYELEYKLLHIRFIWLVNKFLLSNKSVGKKFLNTTFYPRQKGLSKLKSKNFKLEYAKIFI